MKKLLFLCILTFPLAILAAVQQPIFEPLPAEKNHENVAYTQLDNVHQMERKVHYVRDGDITRILRENKEILRITQSKDGKETTWEFPNSSMVKKMVFTLPVFELPDGSQVWGIIYEQLKGSPFKIREKNIAVKVERNSSSSTYSYVYLFPTGSRQLEKVTYSKKSRLPEKSDLLMIVPYQGKERVTSHVSLIRDVD